MTEESKCSKCGLEGVWLCPKFDCPMKSAHREARSNWKKLRDSHPSTSFKNTSGLSEAMRIASGERFK